MLGNAKRLHALGFGIIWIKPSSKLPLENGWAQGDRKTWKALEDTYRYGMNVGVRLGLASKINGGYLAAIDCDVKSADPHHRLEMEKTLRSLIAFQTPVVQSGRGNGSRHLYVRTEQPIKSFRFSASTEKVKLLMPSVKPSKHEMQALNPGELAKGIRLRSAWEISVMGEGRQMVLPPSIHPDTGGTYEWSTPLDGVTLLPPLILKGEHQKQITPVDRRASDFQAVTVDLVGSSLSDKIVDMILTGEGCSDRSAALFTVGMAMVKAGFAENEIQSVLTDRENYLGNAAFEHANTTSRKRAAEWIRKYTLVKATHEVSAAKDFESEAVVAPLDDSRAVAQAAEVLTHDWRLGLTRTRGDDARPCSTMRNVYLILTNEASPEVIRRDLFAVSDFYGEDTPWGGVAGAELRDIDTIRIKAWLAENYRFEPANDKIEDSLKKIADENGFHPVRDYLDTLEWDGVERIDTWLRDYLGAVAPEPYLSAISRKTLCAMVARVTEPGCKFDQVLILEGKQGCGKSSTVRVLAGQWFSDAPVDVADKDSILNMRSVWALELGELSSMRKADVDSLKEFISRQTDRMRAPYGVRAENFPRQCIFIGTTNSTEYLKDVTGNRRFWPVKVGKLKRKALERDRDQLLAEAKLAYELGEKLYLDSDELVDMASVEQSDRVFVDGLAEKLGDFLAKEHENFPTEKFTVMDLFSDFGPLANWRPGVTEQMRVGVSLKHLGYGKRRATTRDDRKVYWVKEVTHLKV